jgi:C-terminal processing protease CtpA/Prc
MHLTLTGEHVNDEWLRIVRRVENLTSLELKRVDVSDDGLNSVTELSNLQYLRLLYSPITDTSLGPLSKLKQAGAGGALTTLQLYGTRITPDASKRLAKELEGAKVDYRKGGFLGVGGDPFNNVGCLVGRVEPNTAAARAGIQQGDIILSYAGRKVEDFEGLTRMIAENEPGDRVTLEILRGETPLTAEVTLGLFQ